MQIEMKVVDAQLIVRFPFRGYPNVKPCEVRYTLEGKGVAKLAQSEQFCGIEEAHKRFTELLRELGYLKEVVDTKA